MRYYTYKITFPGTPYFYWGYHKDTKKDYWGSPCTHKWVWGFYEAEKQILEWFDTREEAIAVEQRLIKPFLNHPHCLNEGCGPGFSDYASAKGGKLGGRVTSAKNKEKGPEYWEEFVRVGVQGRLLHMEENPEFWSQVGRAAANKRWEDPSQKDVNARSCREVGRRNRGRKWVNNGEEEKTIPANHSPPEGFVWGRLTTSLPHYNKTNN
jgi:hypothetical protein